MKQEKEVREQGFIKKVKAQYKLLHLSSMENYQFLRHIHKYSHDNRLRLFTLTNIAM